MAFFKFRQRGQAPQPEPTGRRSRKDEASAAAQESIETVRRRARHRLLGAVVLVGVAVIGFPLLFDTQPRPIAVNAPIVIPDKDAAGPLRAPESGAHGRSVPADASLDEREEMVPPGARNAEAPVAAPRAAPARPASASSPSAPSAPARAADSAALRATSEADAKAKREAEARAKREAEAKTKREAEAKAKREAEARAKREEDRARREQQAAASDASAPEPDRRAKAEQEAKAKREAEAKRDAEAKRTADAQAKREADAKRQAEAKAKRDEDAKAKREEEAKAKRDDAARARALLEGRSSSNADRKADEPAAKSRYVIQVGAYADDAATRQARQKAEAAGVKTYTQVVETSAGKRTRVRVGPFSSREEAEKASAALKKAGLGAAILGL